MWVVSLEWHREKDGVRMEDKCGQIFLVKRRRCSVIWTVYEELYVKGMCVLDNSSEMSMEGDISIGGLG